MKAIPILETWFLRWIFYNKKCLVIIQRGNGLVDFEYHKVNSKNRVEIFSTKDDVKANLKNPTILGKIPSIHSSFKTPIFLWKEDEGYVTPAFSKQNFGEKVATDYDLLNTFDLGEDFANLNSPSEKAKKGTDWGLYITVASMAATLVVLFILTSIADKLEVALF